MTETLQSIVPVRLKRMIRKSQKALLHYRLRKQLDRRLPRGWRKKLRKIRLSTFPNSTEGGYILGKVLDLLGIPRMQYTPWATYDIIINWQDFTYDKFDALEYLNESYEYSGRRLGDTFKMKCNDTINMKCNNISKKRMGELNLDVFGYPIEIDPTTYVGKVCIKSNNNAAHDGQIIHCPISSENVDASMVYSILINNTMDDMAVDFRVPFVGQVADFFYEKRRSITTRFSNKNNVVFIRKTSEFFNPDEVSLLNRFCKKLNLDYGELDVLRDKDSGKIYVVDVAKTPAGPPNGLSSRDSLKAIVNMAEAFALNLLMTSSERTSQNKMENFELQKV